MLRHILALTFVVCLGLFCGCVTQPKSDPDVLPGSTWNTGNSSPGFTNSEDEQWSKVGRQMRGDAPVQQQSWDPLRDLMESPRAQSIDRSLGVDN